MRHLADDQAALQAIITRHRGSLKQGTKCSDLGINHVSLRDLYVSDIVQETSRFDAMARLQVYSNSYHNRLLECVHEFFPCVAFVVGQSLFDHLAAEYLFLNPSRYRTLASLVDTFPDFIECKRLGLSEQTDALWSRFVVELARLELSFNQTFNDDGPEEEPPMTMDVDIDHLDRLPSNVCLVRSPCLRLTCFDFPTAVFFASFKLGKEMQFPAPQKTYVALSRREYSVDITHLSEEQYRLLQMLSDGVPIRSALAQPFTSYAASDEDLATRVSWIKSWVKWRFFIGVAERHDNLFVARSKGVHE